MSLDLTQDAKSVATAIIEPFNRRDFDAMLALSDGEADYTDVALGRRITDAEEFKAAMRAWVEAFSDLRGTVTSAARDGDLLAYEVTFEGTHTGALQTPMGAIPASGRRITSRSTHFVELEGDRVVAVRDYGDTLTLLAQVGAIPAQGESVEAHSPTSAG